MNDHIEKNGDFDLFGSKIVSAEVTNIPETAKMVRGAIPKAGWGSEDHPLKIGDIEIPCYVLEDGRRVLVQGSMIKALDMSQGTAGGKGSGDRLA